MPTDSRDELDAIPGDDDSSLSDSDAKALLKESRKRQSGLNTSIDRLQKKRAELEKELADSRSGHEEELSKVRVALKDQEKQLKTLETERDTERKTRAELEAQLNRAKIKQDADKLISEKYPNLIADHLSGDLKIRSDFEKDEEYTAYLDRMSKRFGGKPADEETETDKGEADKKDTRSDLRDNMRGATPSASVRLTADGKKTRPIADIEDELAHLSHRDPEYAKKRDKLFAEMDAATR